MYVCVCIYIYIYMYIEKYIYFHEYIHACEFHFNLLASTELSSRCEQRQALILEVPTTHLKNSMASVYV